MPAPQEGAAAQSYHKQETVRSPYLQAAYKAATLTIPSLFPDSGDASQADRYRKDLPTPWQGLGARGLNNVASKLLLTLFPPSQPIFKYQISPSLTEGIEDDQETAKEVSKIEKLLAQREIELSELIESDAIRPALHEAVRQLLVAGNVLIHLPDRGGMRVFRLNRYVVRRDSYGTVIEAVLKETMARDALPEPVREWMEQQFPYRPAKSHDESRQDEVDIYTHIKLEPGGKSYKVCQEIDGLQVPGSEGTYPSDAPEFIFLRLTRVDGEDYGRGLIEENIGDLTSYDALQQSIITTAANQADLKWLVDPNGQTNVRHLKDAPSGEYVAGRKKDVDALTVDKFADMRSATEVRDDIKVSLSFVFLLNSAVRRNGERVTAVEIREVARELEDSFGGVYTILSQDLQLNVVKRYERRAEKAGNLTSIPKNVVKPVIVTGLESIGRSHDLDKIRLFFDELTRLATIDPEVARYLHTGEWINRIGTALAVPQKGLVRDGEEVQAEIQKERQDAQRAELMSRAAPNAINQLGSAMQNAQAPQEEP